MKVYANSTPDTESILSSYIGKDVWLRCMFTAYHKYPEVGYIRVIGSFDYAGKVMFWVNRITDRDLGHGEFVPAYKPKGQCNNALEIRSISPDMLTILSPIQTITTQDLLPGYEPTDPAQFTRYVGRNVWVKVCHKYCDWIESYINIKDISNGVISCDEIGADQVEDYEYDDQPTCPGESFERVTYCVDFLEICQPLEVYGDADLDEIIRENDKIWEEGWDNDPMHQEDDE
jgi:hypothetical protein